MITHSTLPEASPLAGTGPDLELPPSDFTPLPLVAAGDRGAHHSALIIAELDRIQSRIAVLRANARFIDQSATVAVLRRFTVRA